MPHGHRAEHHDHAWGRAEAIEFLESPDRRSREDPDAFWARVGLAPGATVVDVGAGTGYYARPAARRVGPSGAVYAVDLSADLVALVAVRARDERLAQLHAVQSSEARIPLPSSLADVVLFANSLHDVAPPTIDEAVRVLKPSGLLLDLDWNTDEGTPGPPTSIRLSPAAAAKLLAPRGLRPVEQWAVGPWQYALRFERGGEIRGTRRTASGTVKKRTSSRRPPRTTRGSG